MELDNEILYIPLWYKEVIHGEYLIKIKIININENLNNNINDNLNNINDIENNKINNNITIDNENNIYIELEKNIIDIIDNNLIFKIKNKEFHIENKLLYFKSICDYKLPNCGIINPYCEVSEIGQNIEYKSHIFVRLKLK